ncbi:MAG: hypothetical protein P8X85_16305 [Desulfobacterales bacterium]
MGLFRHPSDGGDLFGLSHQSRATTDEQKMANAESIMNIAMQFRLVMFAAIASRANFLN